MRLVSTFLRLYKLQRKAGRRVGLFGLPSWTELKKFIDEFIYPLAEGEETVSHINNLWTVFHQKLEYRQLPPTELKTFDGNSSPWPEFIADFKGRVHLKQTFTNQMPIRRLSNALTDDAKQSVESIEKSRLFMLLHLSHQNQISDMHFKFLTQNWVNYLPSHKLKQTTS